jgi:hypothetical protein
MKLLILLWSIFSEKFDTVKPVEYSSKGVIPSCDKVPVEIVEMPDVLKKVPNFVIIPIIRTRPATNNELKFNVKK